MIAYAVEIIFDSTTPSATILCTERSLVVRFEIEDEQQYLDQRNAERAEISKEWAIPLPAYETMEDAKKHLVGRIDDVCAPCEMYGVVMKAPSPRVECYWWHGQLDMHIIGLQPGDSSLSICVPRQPDDYEALRKACASILGALDDIEKAARERQS